MKAIMVTPTKALYPFDGHTSQDVIDRLKFMKHMAQQNKIGNSDKSQTAVELLHKESNELITKYLDGKIDKRELITMHHNILYVHKEMEKEQIMKAARRGHFDCVRQSAKTSKEYIAYGEQYYNETYKP